MDDYLQRLLKKQTALAGKTEPDAPEWEQTAQGLFPGQIRQQAEGGMPDAGAAGWSAAASAASQAKAMLEKLEKAAAMVPVLREEKAAEKSRQLLHETLPEAKPVSGYGALIAAGGQADAYEEASGGRAIWKVPQQMEEVSRFFERDARRYG